MPRIYISGSIDSGDMSPVEDIVFARYDEKGILKDAFSINLILATDASVTIEEIPIPSPGGGETGEMIYAIGVDLTLFQNDFGSAKRIALHDSYYWQPHVLFQNLNCLATVTVDQGGKRRLLGDADPAFVKYNNVEAFRDEFGVGLRMADSAVGMERKLRIIGKGATCEYVSKRFVSKARFYAQFPVLYIDTGTTIVGV